jgi:glycosyltransferase involved in cell wall biosynthesis
MTSNSPSAFLQTPPPPGRLLIVEEALRSVKGHWFEYIKTIADCCRRAGDDVTVAAHQQADQRIIDELEARPVLPYSAWDKIYDSPNPIKRYAGVFQHNWRFYRAVDRILAKEEKFDCILAPTLLIHHLIAWTRLARKYRGRKFGKMVLFFVNGQGIYQGPGKPAEFPRHPKVALFRKLLQSLRPLVESGEVVLAAETEGMAREYSDFCGIPFQCFPHVVQFESTPRMASRHDHQTTFACFGFARHEKGSDLLQDAILQIRNRRPDLNLRFLIQWLDDFNLPDGTPVTRHPKLLSDPDTIFITGALDNAAYTRYLSELDGMILPYRARSYYARVSRVAIEAAIMGIPMVYTRDTWLEEMVRLCGAGEGFQDENLEDLIGAITRLAEQIRYHKISAESRQDLARDLYSPEQFRTCLLSDTRWAAQTRPLTPA